jgi:hypothetical protein
MSVTSRCECFREIGEDVKTLLDKNEQVMEKSVMRDSKLLNAGAFCALRSVIKLINEKYLDESFALYQAGTK